MIRLRVCWHFCYTSLFGTTGKVCAFGRAEESSAGRARTQKLLIYNSKLILLLIEYFQLILLEPWRHVLMRMLLAYLPICIRFCDSLLTSRHSYIRICISRLMFSLNNTAFASAPITCTLVPTLVVHLYDIPVGLRLLCSWWRLLIHIHAYDEFKTKQLSLAVVDYVKNTKLNFAIGLRKCPQLGPDNRSKSKRGYSGSKYYEELEYRFILVNLRVSTNCSDLFINMRRPCLSYLVCSLEICIAT